MQRRRRSAKVLGLASAVLLVAGCTASEQATVVQPDDDRATAHHPATPADKPTKSLPPAGDGDASGVAPAPSPQEAEVELVEGAPGCDPSTSFHSVGLHEGKATNQGLDAWVLAHRPPPWDVDQEVKVIWRVGGSGTASFVAVGEDGKQVAPSWGPNAHEGSSFNRPGEEWGTAFALPTQGCWELRVSRDEGHASIWLHITPQ